jgi:hypothetical protein
VLKAIQMLEPSEADSLGEVQRVTFDDSKPAFAETRELKCNLVATWWRHLQ